MTTRLIQSRQGLGSLPVHCLLIDKSSWLAGAQGRSSHACALAGVQSDSGSDALAAWNRRDLGTRRTSINPRASVVFEGGRRHLLAFLAKLGVSTNTQTLHTNHHGRQGGVRLHC